MSFEIETTSLTMPALPIAVRWHRSAEQAVQVFTKRGCPPDEAENVWNAITAISDGSNDCPWADALRTTIPLTAVSHVRAREVAAVYAFAIASLLRPQSWQYDFELREAAKKVWEEWEKRKATAALLHTGYGWDWSPAWEHVRNVELLPQHQFELVAEIADLAGRMHQALSATGPKVQTDDPHEIKDVTVGGDPEQLLASEIAKLATPGLDDAQAIAILEDQAYQYKQKGTNTAIRGPLVLVIDESGSMANQRNVWAKSALVALTRIAHDGNRMVRVVHFSTSTAVSELPPGDHAKVLDVVKHFLDGGTDISTALERAVEQVGDLEKNGHIGADIVLVTDGEDRDYANQEATLKAAHARQIRLWTVGIGVTIGGNNPLSTYAEKVINLRAGMDPTTLAAELQEAANSDVSLEDQLAAEVLRGHTPGSFEN